MDGWMDERGESRKKLLQIDDGGREQDMQTTVCL